MEVTVCTNASEMIAHRAGETKTFNLEKFNSNFQVRSGYGIELLGTEDHLIAIGGDVLYLFRTTEQEKMLEFMHSVSFNGGQVGSCQPSARMACWELPNQFAFVPGEGRVSMWEINDSDDSNGSCILEEIETIHWKKPLGTFAVGRNYLGARGHYEHDNDPVVEDQNTIWLFSGSTGEMIKSLKELNVPEVEGNRLSTGDMDFVGNLLVATSNVGNAICVWDVKQGTLLCRHEDAFDKGISLPLHINSYAGEVKKMIRIRNPYSLIFLASATSSMCVWSFFYSWRGQTMAHNLAHREEQLMKCRNVLDS